MRQHIREFTNFHKHLDDALNDYLKEHPNYSIDKITVLGQAMDTNDRILVVFNVKEPQKDRLEDKSNEELKKIRGSMACGFEAADRIDKILKSRNYV